MAKIEFSGIDEYSAKLQKLGAAGIGICKAAVYEGADEVADAIRASVQALPTVDEKSAIAAWRSGKPTDGITEAQKQGLLNGLSVAKMQTDGGYVNTRIDFVGYNSVQTRAYPSGQPNAVIARAMESGSSARKKQPFVRKAANAARPRAEARMGDKIKDMVDKIMEN